MCPDSVRKFCSSCSGAHKNVWTEISRRTRGSQAANLGDAPGSGEDQGSLVASRVRFVGCKPDQLFLLPDTSFGHLPSRTLSLSSLLRSRKSWCLVDLCVSYLFVFFLVLVYFGTMGQKITTPPPSLALDHWGEVRVRVYNLLVEVIKGPTQTICASEWPTFQVDCPPPPGIF